MNLPRTGVIRYNLADRERKHRGPDRNFDIPVAVALINSPVIQEKIKHGDMLGYFGHWPRVQFGLNPAEGGIVNGRQVAVEPAIRTVYCKAFPDGTVEHETEFFTGNAGGKLAWRLFQQKAGGFSSAIRAPTIAGKEIAREFHGFDYVLEPNYTRNRGYGLALDGVTSEEDLYDAVAERHQIMELCATMLDSVQVEYDHMASALAKAQDHITLLTGELARKGRSVVLDSVGVLDVVTRPIAPPSHLAHADDFLDAVLIHQEKPKSEPAKLSASHERQLSRYGVL